MNVRNENVLSSHVERLTEQKHFEFMFSHPSDEHKKTNRICKKVAKMGVKSRVFYSDAQRNNLLLYISKCKKLIVYFRRKEAKTQTPVYIGGAEVELRWSRLTV